MLKYRHAEKDSCGVGAIVNIHGIKSNSVLRNGVSALVRLAHRGAVGHDGKTGDGCGVSIQIPDEYFRQELVKEQFKLAVHYAAGNVFLSSINIDQQKQCIIDQCSSFGFDEIFLRTVPINIGILGSIATDNLPHILQLFINCPHDLAAEDFTVKLYILRKSIEKKLETNSDFFICSLSTKTIVYKALCLADALTDFYLDLAHENVKTSICIFHQRFSTNTAPSWKLAHPFRYLAHNGEINTISANRAWARSRIHGIASEQIKQYLPDMASIVNEYGSDSLSLDNMLEFMLMNGMDFKQAIRVLIPPYFHNNPDLVQDMQQFYEYYATMFEPWDGPAGVVFSNGEQVLCTLDRNGLRPLRYMITTDGHFIVASEIGVVDYSNTEIVHKGRIGAGEVLVIDTVKKQIFTDHEVGQMLLHNHSDLNRVTYTELETGTVENTSSDNQLLDVYKKLFLISQEEIEMVLKVSAIDALEPTISMGDDTAIAILSRTTKSISDYFRQSFAQVTNPAIDSLRERYVMSLNSYIPITPDNYIRFTSPILAPGQFKQLINNSTLSSCQLDLNFNPTQYSLQQAIINLCSIAAKAVKSGIRLLVISDSDIRKNDLIVPALMAVGAIHNHLIKQQLRLKCDLIVATGCARDPHHFALFLSYGATLIYPYLTYHIFHDLHYKQKFGNDIYIIRDNYINSINKGILKIMSKMGIATLSSYRASHLFEALGIHDDIVNLCFTGTPTRISGANFIDFQQQLNTIATNSWNPDTRLNIGGSLKYVHNGEYHAFNPDVVNALQKSAKSAAIEDYQVFANLVNNRAPTTIRDLFKLKTVTHTQPKEAIESLDELYKKFDTAAMSIGALGAEAHEALATAMNTLGGRSNSGEGGEDPGRYNTITNSKIKQLASGRFGATPHYLMSAEVIQIKIAQGAKPGEGGQLPGNKVTLEIGKLRYATPGVTLISPPPHHDIYSIEDLAQLIFDLKQLNTKALISVKLVSEPGIGVIACGVAKANADLITISGYDGGTGAAPITSIKNVGSPWELGIAETHNALVQNRLRHKVRLQVDGGLKTGLDVIKAAILGAETFGFGTGPMIALGCKYLKICHLNNCATGIATQDEVLRRNHFHGLPAMVIAYFKGIANEVRDIMHQLGVANLTDLIGRTDLLTICKDKSELDLSSILELSSIKSEYSLFQTEINSPRDQGLLNQQIYSDCLSAIKQNTSISLEYLINNTQRSVGATISGEIVKHYGVYGITNHPIKLHFSGTAGQSFGVWLCNGMELYLNGDANDYVAKGMSGGKIVIKHQLVNQSENVVTVMGNTCLYGATGGKLYANGAAGDRFAIRNSGVYAVVEGVANNACEYMTGGVIGILGTIGHNFGAGMTGGMCYVLCDITNVNLRINHDFVNALGFSDLGDTLEYHSENFRNMLDMHYAETQSPKAAKVLAEFTQYLHQVVLIKPKGIKLTDTVTHLTR